MKTHEHLCLDWLGLHNYISQAGRVVLGAQHQRRRLPILFPRCSTQLTPDPTVLLGKRGYWEAPHYIKICNANPTKPLHGTSDRSRYSWSTTITYVPVQHTDVLCQCSASYQYNPEVVSIYRLPLSQPVSVISALLPPF